MSNNDKFRFTKSRLKDLEKASNCNRYFVYDTYALAGTRAQIPFILPKP